MPTGVNAGDLGAERVFAACAQANPLWPEGLVHGNCRAGFAPVISRPTRRNRRRSAVGFGAMAAARDQAGSKGRVMTQPGRLKPFLFATLSFAIALALS